MLVTLHDSLHNYFGSISHAPAAMIKKHRKHANSEIPLSSIKIADALMGEKIIALLRLLRLRHPLAATIHSNGFRKLNM